MVGFVSGLVVCAVPCRACWKESFVLEVAVAASEVEIYVGKGRETTGGRGCMGDCSVKVSQCRVCLLVLVGTPRGL